MKVHSCSNHCLYNILSRIQIEIANDENSLTSKTTKAYLSKNWRGKRQNIEDVIIQIKYHSENKLTTGQSFNSSGLEKSKHFGRIYILASSVYFLKDADMHAHSNDWAE